MRHIFALLFFPFFALAADPVPCGQCLALERLSPELRKTSEQLLLKVLDSEGLYTLITGLKPMSSGMSPFEFMTIDADLSKVEEARQAVAAWRCGDSIFATVFSFNKTHEGKRFADLVVINPGSFSAMLASHQSFFSRFGLSPSAHPMEALIAIEHNSGVARLEGQGYFFGYPDYAVRWFAEAEAYFRETGKFVQRDFRSFATFARAERGVVWAVAKGDPERSEDRAFGAAAKAVLDAYRARRKLYIGEGKPGPAALLRDWYRGTGDQCSVDFAKP